jgi:hypothetical protein
VDPSSTTQLASLPACLPPGGAHRPGPAAPHPPCAPPRRLCRRLGVARTCSRWRRVFYGQPGLWRSLTIDPATRPEGCRPRAWLSAKLALLQRVGWAVECFNLRPGVPLGGAKLAGALRCLTPAAARSVWLLSEQAPGDASWAALARLSQLTELDVPQPAPRRRGAAASAAAPGQHALGLR